MDIEYSFDIETEIIEGDSDTMAQNKHSGINLQAPTSITNS